MANQLQFHLIDVPLAPGRSRHKARRGMRRRTNKARMDSLPFLTTQVERFVGWARQFSLWPLPFGTACCAIEYMSVVSAHYDVSRFGAEAVRFSPRQSDLLIVEGTIVDKMGPVLKRIYEQMPEPKWVIAMGVCASSGGFYRAYHVMQGIDEIIPVDVYVPGCPPTPEGLIYAIMMVQKMARENQPRRNYLLPMSAKLEPFVHKPLARWPSAALDPFPEEGSGSPVAARLLHAFPDAVLGARDGRDMPAVTVRPESIRAVCAFLKEDPELQFDMLGDLCGVDYLGRDPRFEAVYHLYSTEKNHRLRLKAPLPESHIELDSVTPVWDGADWFEREAFDLFGFRFRGHPNLRKILTHEDFAAHALRKDHNPGDRFECHTQVENLFTPSDYPESRDPGETGEVTIINMGPSHPAMHGTLRVQLMIEGERILRSRAEIGYLHRCFEKMSETHTYHQVIPFTDRLNYVSSFMNNMGYCMAMEQMMGVEVPERARVLRVILAEFHRVMDHFVCIGTNLVDMGALTNFWYFFRPREEIYTMIEACCGARLTVSHGRIGGFVFDMPADFTDRCRALLKSIPRYLADVDALITRNRIFQDRTRGIGTVTREQAIAWGFTGPCLRASGVPYDVRKAQPYSDYDRFEFQIPTDTAGDTYARYLVRFEEMRQSLNIIRQALDVLPGGPVITADRRVALPPKKGVYSNIEDLMNHFKLIMHGILPPRGEFYSCTEAANGELGFYIVSDGTKNPYRIKVRPPCFAIFQSMDHILDGLMLADAIASVGSLNIVAGELDR